MFDTSLTQPADSGEIFTKPVILLAGRIVGIWQRKLKKDEVVFDTHLLTTLTSAEQRAVDAALERYSEFFELPAVYT